MEKILWETALEQELVYMFRFKMNTDESNIKINTHELDDGRFWTAKEILEHCEKGIFTPNLESELKKLFPAALG